MQSFDLVVSVEIARRGKVSTRSRGHLVSFTYTFASGLLVPVTGWSAGYLWLMSRVKLGKARSQLFCKFRPLAYSCGRMQAGTRKRVRPAVRNYAVYMNTDTVRSDE
jgi:hypothetical protein